MMRQVQPLAGICGPVAVIAPHMDDEVIGCGALLASLAARNESIHVFFAGEGLGSFSPRFVADRGRDRLIDMRYEEAITALGYLGVGPGAVTCGGFREWRFSSNRNALQARLDDWLNVVCPAVVLAPFRLDCHPDHTIIGRLAHSWVSKRADVRLLEYFVYHRLRLIPGGDMRGLIQSHYLRAHRDTSFCKQKEEALRAYVSQVTSIDPVRRIKVLDDAFIAAMVHDAECYLDAGGEPLAKAMRHYCFARQVSYWQFRLKRMRHRLKGDLPY